MGGKAVRSPEGASRGLAWTRHAGPVLLLWLVAALYLTPSLLLARVPLPADVLLLQPPWSAYAEQFGWFEKVHNPVLDVIEQYYPWRAFAGQELATGRVPLWNPQVLCGAPFLATGQSALLYPFTWLFALDRGPAAWGLYLWLHLGLAASFAYALATSLARSRAAAVTTGLVFAFSGFFLAWLEYLTFLSSGVWLACALWTWERARAGHLRYLPLLGLALGLSVLAGHLQVAAYVWVALVVWAILREFERAPRAWGRAAGLLGAAFGLGALISAGQWLPTVELALASARAGTVTAAQVWGNSLPFGHLAALLVPFFFGDNYIQGAYWGHFNFIETCGYVGIPTLLLAGLALGAWKRMPAPGRLPALVLAGIGLLWSFRTGLALLFFWTLPGFGQLPNVGRALFLFCFGMALLAGAGLDCLGAYTEARAKRAALWWFAAIGVALGACWIALQLSPFASAADLPASPERDTALATFQLGLKGLGLAALSALGAGLLLLIASDRARRPFAAAGLVLLLAVDLAAFGARLNPQLPAELLTLKPKLLETIGQPASGQRIWSFGPGLRQLRPNLGMSLWLEDVRGYDSLYPGQYAPVLAQLDKVESAEAALKRLPLLRALGVEWLITAEPVFSADLIALGKPDAFLYRLRSTSPFAYCTTDLQTASQESALEQLLSGQTPGKIILAESAGIAAQRGLVPSLSSGTAVERPWADLLLIKTYTDAPAWLVVLNQHCPGWQAWLDGQSISLERANALFQSVRLEEPGNHKLQLAYRPDSFRLGLYLSLTGLFLLALLTGVLRPRAAL